MGSWTMAVEAVPPMLSAVAIEDDETRVIDAELADGDGDALTRSLVAALRAHGTYPDHLVMVVPGDVATERYTDLAEAASLTGLPDPSWVPDAVARAGESIASWSSGTTAVVIDARGEDVVAWPVRRAAHGVVIAATRPENVSTRLDTLLGGVVQAKLSVVAPAFAESLRRRDDVTARRDAAHLARELRTARRLLSSSDGEELVVSAGTAEVTINREEFARLAQHALRAAVVALLGTEDVDELPRLVVADAISPIVEHLTCPRSVVLIDEQGDATRRGVSALVRRRAPDAFVDPDPTDGIPAPEAAGEPEATPTELADVPPQRTAKDRSRTVASVVALSALLALVTAASGASLAVDPGASGPGPAESASPQLIVPAGR